MKSILSAGMMTILALSFTTPAVQADSEVTVQGIVQYHAGDMEGNTTEVAIDNGTIYVVVPSGRGADLLDYEGQAVVATGMANRDEASGMVNLTVADFYAVGN